MKSNNFKTLLASTVLAAAISPGIALATDVSASITATGTTTVSPTLSIVSGGSIVVADGIALTMNNGTAASNTLTLTAAGGKVGVTGTAAVATVALTTDGTITIEAGELLDNLSTASTGVILGSAAADLTLNNSGTITGAAGTGNAVDMSGSTGNATITNTGTGVITGDVLLSSSDSTVTNAGLVTGVITGLAGNDTVTLEGTGTVTGLIDLGAGDNTVTVSGTTAGFGAGLTTLGGADTLNFNLATSSTVFTTGGVINLGAGSDTINVNSGTLTQGAFAISGVEDITLGNDATLNLVGLYDGTVTGNGGANNLIISNIAATVGAIDLGAGNNTVNVSDTASFGAALTGGAGDDTLNISMATSVTALTLGGAVDLGAGGSNTINLNAGELIQGGNVISNVDKIMMNGVDTSLELAAAFGGDVIGSTGIQYLDLATGATVGDISGVENIAIANTITLASTVTGASTLTVDTGATLTLNANSVTSTKTLLNGTSGLILTNASTLTGDVMSGSAAVTTIAVTSGTIAGNITGNTGIDTLTITEGTVSGNVALGAGADVLNVAASGTIAGTVTLGAGIDAVTWNALSLTAIDAGADADTLTVAGAATVTTAGIIKGFTGGTTVTSDFVVAHDFEGGLATVAAAKTLTINAGTFDGNITTVTGIVDLNAGTVSGTVAMTGAGTLNLDGGIVKGAITGSTGAVNVSNVYTTQDTIGALALNVSGTLNVAHDVTLAGALDVEGGALNIASGKTVSTIAYASTADSALTFNISDAATANLTSSGAVDLSLASITVSVDASSGYVAAGSRTIVTGAAPATNALAVIDNSYALDFVTAVNANNIDLGITRANDYDDAVLTSGDTTVRNVASVLNTLAGSATGELATIIGNLDSLATASAVEEAMESLAPASDAAIASVSFGAATKALGTVSTRLASLRNGSTGIATGDAMANRNVWMQAYTGSADQDERDNVDGYEADTVGFAVGLDSDDIIDDAVVGLSFAVGESNVNSDAANNAGTDISSYMLTGYYSRDLANGSFVDAMVGYGLNSYEGTRDIVAINARAVSDYEGEQYSAKATIGRNVAMGNMTVTPKASVAYSNLSIDNYTESGAGGANLTVDSDDIAALVFSVGGEAAWNVAMNGAQYTPSLRAMLNYDVLSEEMESTSNFAGGGTSFQTEGMDAAEVSLDLGAGLDFTTDSGVNLSFNYDAEIKQDFLGHNATVKARWEF